MKKLTRLALLFAVLLTLGAVQSQHPVIVAATQIRRDENNRTLTFADRVTYQRAIEEVYWQHRIWPKANAGPKPPLEKVMSQAQIEKKVQDYLRNSQALEDYWQKPITPEQLQTEMDRMAQHTKQPEVLRELFAALGNDPFVIAECLAKPGLSERLVTNFYAHDPENLEAWKARTQVQTRSDMAVGTANYALPPITDQRSRRIDDSWTATTRINAPTGRERHTAVWTGNEVIVWGGFDENFVPLNTG